MENQASKENDEEVMRVPKHLKVASANDFHRGSDNEDEGKSYDDTCETSDSGEDKNCWSLENKETRLEKAYHIPLYSTELSCNLLFMRLGLVRFF